MRRAWILSISLLAVLVLLIGMGVGACGGGNGGDGAPPGEGEVTTQPGEEEGPPPPSNLHFTSDDGRIEFALDNVERTKVWPAELEDGGTPKEVYDFIVVDVTIVRITDGHVNGSRGSAIVGYDEVKYQALSGTWWGVEFKDLHDPEAGYEIVEGATGKFVFELPEEVQPVKLELAYLFFESWTESWELVGEEERYIDIILH